MKTKNFEVLNSPFVIKVHNINAGNTLLKVSNVGHTTTRYVMMQVQPQYDESIKNKGGHIVLELGIFPTNIQPQKSVELPVVLVDDASTNTFKIKLTWMDEFDKLKSADTFINVLAQ